MVKIAVYVFRCPKCGFVIVNQSLREVTFQAKQHMIRHRISITRDEIMQVLLTREIEVD